MIDDLLREITNEFIKEVKDRSVVDESHWHVNQYNSTVERGNYSLSTNNTHLTIEFYNYKALLLNYNRFSDMMKRGKRPGEKTMGYVVYEFHYADTNFLNDLITKLNFIINSSFSLRYLRKAKK